MVIAYIFISLAIIAIIVGGSILFKYTKKNDCIYAKAAVIDHKVETMTFKDSKGKEHSRVIKMTLLFQLQDNSLKSFQITPKMKGHAPEKQWGTLCYRGDTLLKFECEGGSIGKKLYMTNPDDVLNSIFGTKKQHKVKEAEKSFDDIVNFKRKNEIESAQNISNSSDSVNERDNPFI